jgi:hypothetical protein
MKINDILMDSVHVCRKHPLVFVPMLASVVIVSLLSLLLVGSAIPFAGTATPEQMIAGAGMALGGIMLFSILTMLVSLLAHGMTVIMAYDAVEGRSVTLKDGWTKTMERIVPLVIASIIVGLLLGIGFALLILPGLILALFLMFTFPAVMVDRKDAFRAISGSFRMAGHNFGTVFVIFLVAIALAVLFTLANMIVSLIPALGFVVAIILSCAFSGYLSVFILQAYLALRETPPAPDVEV